MKFLFHSVDARVLGHNVKHILVVDRIKKYLVQHWCGIMNDIGERIQRHRSCPGQTWRSTIKYGEGSIIAGRVSQRPHIMALLF